VEKGPGPPRMMNATRWLLEELGASPEDAVIVKMDIEVRKNRKGPTAMADCTVLCCPYSTVL